MGEHDAIFVRIDAIQAQVCDVAHAVFGNGREGLKAEVLKMNIAIEELTRARVRAEQREEQKAQDFRRALYAAIGSVVVSVIVGAGSFLYSAYERQQTELIVRAAVQQLGGAHGLAAPAASSAR